MHRRAMSRLLEMAAMVCKYMDLYRKNRWYPGPFFAFFEAAEDSARQFRPDIRPWGGAGVDGETVLAMLDELRQEVLVPLRRRLRELRLAPLTTDHEAIIAMVILSADDDLSYELIRDDPRLWAALERPELLFKCLVGARSRTVKDICATSAERLSWQDMFEEPGEWQSRAHLTVLKWARAQRDKLLRMTPSEAKRALASVPVPMRSMIEKHTASSFRPDWTYLKHRVLSLDMQGVSEDGTCRAVDIDEHPQAVTNDGDRAAMVDKRTACRGLSPLERDALRGKADGVTQKEIGAIHGVNQSAVSQALKRARRKMGID